MNRYTANLYFLFIVISIVSSFTHTAFAEPIGGDETICARCCGLESEDFPSGTKPCTEQFGGAGLISTSLGTMGETQPISNAQAANGAGLGLSLNYVSYNADGEKASLNTVMGYGWSHSYNTLLFSQGRDLFKMSPSGFVTKYQRSGRTGPLKPESRYFCRKIFSGILLEKIGKNHATAYAFGAPIRPRHLVPTQQGVGTLVLA